MIEKINIQDKKIAKLEKKNKKLEQDYENLYNAIKFNYAIQTQHSKVIYQAPNPNNLSIDSKIFQTEEEILFIKNKISEVKYKKALSSFFPIYSSVPSK